MDNTAKQVTEEEIACVADRLARAYPYIRAQKQREGVLDEPPLHSLIRGILSQHTTDRNRDTAFAALRSRYPDWRQVTAVPPDELAVTIRATNHAYTKAQRIQDILLRIPQERGAPTLDFLRSWPTEKILDYLHAFPGVGNKTAAIVCLFALGRPVMPVDTHVFRVTQRLGWLPAKVTLERAHRILQALVPAPLVFPFHLSCWEHGHTTCRPTPRCAQCAIYEYCLYQEKTAPPPDVQAAIAITSGHFSQAA